MNNFDAALSSSSILQKLNMADWTEVARNTPAPTQPKNLKPAEAESGLGIERQEQDGFSPTETERSPRISEEIFSLLRQAIEAKSATSPAEPAKMAEVNNIVEGTIQSDEGETKDKSPQLKVGQGIAGKEAVKSEGNYLIADKKAKQGQESSVPKDEVDKIIISNNAKLQEIVQGQNERLQFGQQQQLDYRNARLQMNMMERNAWGSYNNGRMFGTGAANAFWGANQMNNPYNNFNNYGMTNMYGQQALAGYGTTGMYGPQAFAGLGDANWYDQMGAMGPMFGANNYMGGAWNAAAGYPPGYYGPGMPMY
jgi:hypothetical protein